MKRDDGRVRRVLQTTDGTQFGVSLQSLRSTLDRCITDISIRNAVGADYAAQPMIMVGLLAEATLKEKGVATLVPAAVNPDAPQLDWLATSPSGLVQLRLAECLGPLRADPGPPAPLRRGAARGLPRGRGALRHPDRQPPPGRQPDRRGGGRPRGRACRRGGARGRGAAERGRPVNLVAVDFYGSRDLLATVDELNRRLSAGD